MDERRLLTPQPLHPQPEQFPLHEAQFEHVQGAIVDDDDNIDVLFVGLTSVY